MGADLEAEETVKLMSSASIREVIPANCPVFMFKSA
jgi:hypothetical protein